MSQELGRLERDGKVVADKVVFDIHEQTPIRGGVERLKTFRATTVIPSAVAWDCHGATLRMVLKDGTSGDVILTCPRAPVGEFTLPRLLATPNHTSSGKS